MRAALIGMTLWTSSCAPAPPAPEVEPVPTPRKEMFVTSAFASVCPTAAQALANDCGHTVEDDTRGYRRLRGQTVTVLGAEPVDGVWRAIRYMKSGEQDGFVAASTVAASPPPPDAGPLDAAAPEALDLRTTNPIELAPGTLGVVRDLRADVIGVVTAPRHGEPMPVSPVTLAITAPTLSVRLPVCFADDQGRPFDAYHGCLENMDCATLDYRCGEHECDTVSLLVRRLEGDQATFEAVMIVDRMGVFRCAVTD